MTDDDPTEAIRYRRRLRDTEVERDTLAARVAALQRAHIDSLLAREHISAEAVFAVAELDHLLGEDGLPDPVKVTDAARKARQELGLGGLYVPAEGKLPTTTPPPTFSDAFTPPR